MAFRVAVASDLGQLRAADGVERAAALDRGRVEQQHVVAGARALSGEHPNQPLDRVRQPRAPLVQSVLAWQLREQVRELAPSRPQEPAIARDPHQHLGDTQRHDLRVSQLPPRVARPLRKQVVRRAVDADTEQVEVGAHRGLLVDVALTTPTSTCLSPTLDATRPVASII
jgi:hypothetical protein